MIHINLLLQAQEDTKEEKKDPIKFIASQRKRVHYSRISKNQLEKAHQSAALRIELSKAVMDNNKNQNSQTFLLKNKDQDSNLRNFSLCSLRNLNTKSLIKQHPIRELHSKDLCFHLKMTFPKKSMILLLLFLLQKEMILRILLAMMKHNLQRENCIQMSFL